jgi:hypothetical protein
MSQLKIESARRQLGTALALFLDDRDPVSVHCLAGGGCELIEYYAKKAGAEPFTTHILKTHPDMNIKELRRVQRQYWTPFKHAIHQHSKEERDDDKLLSRFTDVQNDSALFIGWYDYAQATNTMPVEAQVQQVWYTALNLEKLDAKYPREPYEKSFPDLLAKPRAEQKRMLNEAIERMREDPQVMSDPRTDTRPLMVGWP